MNLSSPAVSSVLCACLLFCSCKLTALGADQNDNADSKKKQASTIVTRNPLGRNMPETDSDTDPAEAATPEPGVDNSDNGRKAKKSGRYGNTHIDAKYAPISLGTGKKGNLGGVQLSQSNDPEKIVSLRQKSTGGTILVRAINHKGEMSYMTFRNQEKVEAVKSKLTKDYEAVLKSWEAKEAQIKKRRPDFEYDMPRPFAPTVEVVKDALSSSQANALKKEQKDWAVYRISVAGKETLKIGNAHTDALLQAQAKARYARSRNSWLLKGKPALSEPAAPEVSKETANLSKGDAKKSFQELELKGKKGKAAKQ